MVVVATMLVVQPDEKGPRPCGRAHDGLDHIGDEALTEADVLWVLLVLALGPQLLREGLSGKQSADDVEPAKVWIDQGEGRKSSRRRVDVEL